MERMTSEIAKEKGRKGGLGKRGSKAKRTILKEAIGPDAVIDMAELAKKNMQYFMTHPEEKTRLDATKAFSDYYMPKKKELSGSIDTNLSITFVEDLK